MENQVNGPRPEIRSGHLHFKRTPWHADTNAGPAFLDFALAAPGAVLSTSWDLVECIRKHLELLFWHSHWNQGEKLLHLTRQFLQLSSTDSEYAVYLAW